MPPQINTPGDFAVALCRGLNVPVTQSNVQFLIAWSRAEGGHWNNKAYYNPLNTTQPEPGALSMNSVGVKAYTSWDQGIAATVTALRNGRYNDIVASLQQGDAAQTAAQAASLRTWSGGGYGTIISLIPGSGRAAQQALATAGATADLGSPALGGQVLGSQDSVAMPVMARPVSTVLDPADLMDFARVLDQRADATVTLQDQLTRALGSASWAGPASELFRSEAQQSASVLVRDADAIRQAASDLRRMADQLQIELGQLRAIEERVRTWFALNPPSMTSAPPPWPASDLPPTGDPRWRDVQRAFSAIGVT